MLITPEYAELTGKHSNGSSDGAESLTNSEIAMITPTIFEEEFEEHEVLGIGCSSVVKRCTKKKRLEKEAIFAVKIIRVPD